MESSKLTEAERIAGIAALSPTPERKAINYNGTDTVYPVYNVPLKYLLYNQYNGRIKSVVLSHESQYKKKLDATTEEDKDIIEQFLYDSAKARNERTFESIDKIGQQEVGIITKDGVIIDGNRRAMTISLINKKKGKSLEFKAVILPDTLANHEKEIITLETSYQMGVDSKVDYNPIEKYIRCKELLTFYSVEDIAKLMAEDSKRIREWLDILDLMNEYLTHLGTPQNYTRLEKREGHFVDLFKYLKSLKATQHQGVNWHYSDIDIKDMKTAYFTYIRLGIPVARSRVIGRPAGGGSFFSYNDIWREFSAEHKKVLAKAKEDDFQSVKAQFQEYSNEEIIDIIDKNWKKEVEEDLEELLSFHEGELTDKQAHFAPLKLLKRAKNILYQIDQNVLRTDIDEEKKQLISQIDDVVQVFKTF